MPVLAVNRDGVSFAMSFICGLSTMATLIEPPLPAAGLPLEVPPEFELFEPPPPPQPIASAPTTASKAAAGKRRRLPLMGLLLLLQREGRESSATGPTYSVGLCGLSSQCVAFPQLYKGLPRWFACGYMAGWCGQSPSASGKHT